MTKFRVMLKSPDVLSDAIDDIYYDEADEKDRDNARRVSLKFFKYGELLTVEIDLENETCVVIPV